MPFTNIQTLILHTSILILILPKKIGQIKLMQTFKPNRILHYNKKVIITNENDISYEELQIFMIIVYDILTQYSLFRMYEGFMITYSILIQQNFTKHL